MNEMSKRKKRHAPNASVKSESKNTISKDSAEKIRVISLFAGIGGFDKAFELTEAEIVAQCEVDAFCQSILRKHWPKAKLFEDIKALQPESLPDADVWTAGFPCQDVSLARGNHGRNGLKGNHTSLFFEMMRLVEAKQPKVILLENVLGLLNSHNRICAALAEF